MPKTNKYDRQHRANVAYYQRLIDAIFEAATKEAAAIGSRVDFDPSRVFSFDDYPITQDLVKKLLSRLGSGMEAAIVDGVRSEWTLANNKNDELARRVFGDNIGRLTQEQYRRYFSNNDKAREAFLNRKEQGLNLSERVWRYADQFKSDIELGLDIGIRSGLDAPAMSRELQKFLQHPDMLFRRVRDEHGILQLSKRASEFHPGQGVYRSSYKNARRLAATETNMAYMSADHERWQQLDFVVGIEIRLSGNHTCLGRDGKPHEFHDICDELQGRYPKDFKFTGWHPHCRCQAISILKTEKELMEENRAILRGEEPSQESANTVKDVPEGFKKWVTDNEERIARAKTMPYFLRDNGAYWNANGQNGTAQVGLLPAGVARDMGAKINAAMKPTERVFFASFEPFSTVIMQKVAEAIDRKAKNAILESVMADTRAELLNEDKGHRTTLFAGNKGAKSSTWSQTKKMAEELNAAGIDVAFLPEYKDGISADSLIRIGKVYKLADFKYCITVKSNTLAKDLEHGFEQAGTIVLKLENMDSGVFKETIEYLLRNEIPYGDIILVNRYGKVVELPKSEIRTGIYRKRIKGLL